ncbi:hypothetical protein J3D43_003973 [Paenibacillus xylanexedens]|uniref:hypothetical protein n=1 Tax=Paenibacillus xylanexedens TaxID=528191 RepID=UPI00209F774A|nr:hypothetical protein [Paenibacillus xylanexedens]MCP1425457.1 hypothetical protein [Paenibacillus xylanexedens]
MEDGEVVTFLPDFHVYNSKTITISFDDEFILPNDIKRVTKAEINELILDRIEYPRRPEKCWLLKDNRIGIVVMEEVEKVFISFIYEYDKEGFKIVNFEYFDSFDRSTTFLLQKL